MTFQFSWQGRDEDFVKWMFVHLIADMRDDDLESPFEQLSEATDGFTNVKLTMQVNGIEVNAQNFIESVERALENYSQTEARRMLSDVMPNLNDLEDVVSTANKLIEEKLRDVLESGGIEWREYY